MGTNMDSLYIMGDRNMRLISTKHWEIGLDIEEWGLPFSVYRLCKGEIYVLTILCLYIYWEK